MIPCVSPLLRVLILSPCPQRGLDWFSQAVLSYLARALTPGYPTGHLWVWGPFFAYLIISGLMGEDHSSNDNFCVRTDLG